MKAQSYSTEELCSKKIHLLDIARMTEAAQDNCWNLSWANLLSNGGFCSEEMNNTVALLSQRCLKESSSINYK